MPGDHSAGRAEEDTGEDCGVLAASDAGRRGFLRAAEETGVPTATMSAEPPTDIGWG
jgi:hypothetical protein